MSMVRARGGGPLGVKEAYDAIGDYARSYGELPLRLLLHAAVPQSFRADLLNLLKVNFVPEAGGDLSVDADVLLSPLVETTAGGYFLLDPEVRRQSLDLLDAAYRSDGRRRSVRVARFLLTWLDHLERLDAGGIDPLLAEYAAIQRWVALALIDPPAVARSLADCLKDALAAMDKGAVRARLGGIAAALSVPLTGYPALLAYAEGVDALCTGNTAEARRLLAPLGDSEISVGDVNLPSGAEILGRLLTGEGEEAATAITTIREQQSKAINFAEGVIDVALDNRSLGEPTDVPSSETNETARVVRIFISAPSDVANERAIVRDVVENELSYYPDYRSLKLEIIAFDDPNTPISMLAHETPQESVNRARARPANCDIVIVILWRRIGTPLPSAITKPDGEPYLSGTEWEYLDAINSIREPKPLILLYRCIHEPEFNGRDLQKHGILEQYKRVETFFSQLQNTDGSLTGGVILYTTPDGFKRRLRDDLDYLLKAWISGGDGDEKQTQSGQGLAVCYCHAAKDAELGWQIWEGLSSQGIPALNPARDSEPSPDEFLKQLASLQTLIVIVSDAALSSPWLLPAVNTALHSNIRVIPVLAETPSSPILDSPFAHWQWIDPGDPADAQRAVDELIEVLRSEPESRNAPHVYLGYAREDREAAEQLTAALAREGISVWSDRALKPGDRWRDIIENELTNATHVLLLISTKFIGSRWLQNYMNLAAVKGALIAVFVDDDIFRSAAAEELGASPIDLSHWSGESNHPGFRRLVAEISGLSAQTAFRDVDSPWCPEMVVIPEGEFWMGSPEDEAGHEGNESPRHRVTISQPFEIGRFPVTFDEYDHFCEVTRREKPSDAGWGRDRRPVVNISWVEATAYCEWLTKETGRGYRLPSEAEWEYACRAGTTTPFSFGDLLSPEQANYWNSEIGRTTAVGTFPANPWGLSDMHGNVWEWCVDGLRTYGHEAVTDPMGPMGIEVDRAMRGGSFGSSARITRSAFRGAGFPGNGRVEVGFRVARSVEE